MGLTYKDSGVDKEAGYKQVQLIKSIVKDTYTDGVLSELGGFSGMFKPNFKDMEEPILVSGTDGVGSKLKLAFLLDKHDTIGIDCVAMCANDILCQGATPLFFLDYIATDRLVPEKMASIVKGIAEGCKQAGAALIGGETAEMPGFYSEDEYDLAGFVVGMVDRKHIIDGSTIEEGDLLIGLTSSGVHSNGFSLVRKVIFEKQQADINEKIKALNDRSLGEVLLEPTKIYVKSVLPLLEKLKVKGMSHITGGGFYENIPRMLPENLGVKIDVSKIPNQPIFDLIQKWGGIATKEMYGTFNMGIGLVLVIRENDLKTVKEHFNGYGEEVVVLGKLEKGIGVEL